MFEAVEELLLEHADLETKMSDPGVHANSGLARSLGLRYAQLTPIVETYLRWRTLGDDLEAARELGDTDALKVVTDVRDAVRDTNPQLADVDPDTKTRNPDNEGSGVGLGPAGAREHLRSRSNRHPRKPGQRGQCPQAAGPCRP